MEWVRGMPGYTMERSWVVQSGRWSHLVHIGELPFPQGTSWIRTENLFYFRGHALAIALAEGPRVRAWA